MRSTARESCSAESGRYSRHEFWVRLPFCAVGKHELWELAQTWVAPKYGPDSAEATSGNDFGIWARNSAARWRCSNALLLYNPRQSLCRCGLRSDNFGSSLLTPGPRSLCTILFADLGVVWSKPLRAYRMPIPCANVHWTISCVVCSNLFDKLALHGKGRQTQTSETTGTALTAIQQCKR
jgi:hypothetical protein